MLNIFAKISRPRLSLHPTKRQQTLRDYRALPRRVYQVLICAIALVTSLHAAQSQVRVACCGDGITYGQYLTSPDKDSYPARLGSIFGPTYYVANYGRNGTCCYTGANLANALSYSATQDYRNAIAFRPDIVVIMLGVNDAKVVAADPTITQSRLVADFVALITNFQSIPSHPKVVICNTLPVYGNATTMTPLVSTVIPAINAAAAAAGATLVDTFSTMQNPSLFIDGEHPNASGTTVIANDIYVQALSTNVTTQRYDNLRTGANVTEVALTPQSLNTTFGKLFTLPVDGYVNAQPLCVPKVAIPRQSARDLVYVATEHDGLYAFDATSANGSAPVWYDSFVNDTLGIQSVPAGDVGASGVGPEIGIAGTPVIKLGATDASGCNTGTIFAVTATKEPSVSGYNYVQRLHAIDIATGAERAGSPVALQATVAGNGDGTRLDGNGQSVIDYNPFAQTKCTALSLSNGALYVGTGPQDGTASGHGWVLAYDPNTLQQIAAYCSTPNGVGGGLTSTPAFDASGRLFIATGYGQFDLANGNYANSILAIDPSISYQASSSFTPFNQASFVASDSDFGSFSSLLLPDSAGSVSHPHLMLAGAKLGEIYLADRDGLGGYGATDNVVQEVPALPGEGEAAYWNGSLFTSTANAPVSQRNVAGGAMSAVPVTATATSIQLPGKTLAVTSNGLSKGLLWSLDDGDLTGQTILRAFDASNIATAIYDSSVNPLDSGPGAVRGNQAAIANGRVYVTGNGQIAVYGLGSTGVVPSPVLSLTGTLPYQVMVTDSDTSATVRYTLDGSYPTETSAVYVSPLSLSQGTVVRARAFNTGEMSSYTVSAQYAVPQITNVTIIPSNNNGTATFNVAGTGIVATSVVCYGGVPLPTVLGTDGTLTASTSLTGTQDVTFVNPGPLGGTSNGVSETTTYPLPQITKLYQSSATIGLPSLTVYAQGTGFVPGVSSLVFGSLVLPATVDHGGFWSATVPASALTATGIVPISLVNPGPGGGTSAALPFSLVNPVPTVTLVSPSSGIAGIAVPFTVTGTNFVQGAAIRLNGNTLPTTLNADGTLSATVPATFAAGAYSLSVLNPTPGGGASGNSAITLSNPMPVISAVTPTSCFAGSAATLTISGSGFRAVSKAYFGSIALATTLNADGTLTATVPGSAPAGAGSITVVNTAPGGGTSNPASFSISYSVPTISSLYRSSTIVGSPSFTLYASGTGFVAGSSRIVFGATPLPTTLNASGWWTATVPGSLLSTLGIVQVSLLNPTPGGGFSSSLPFTVGNPRPAITSLSPVAAASYAPFPLTVAGTGFIAGSVVKLGATALPTTLNADGTLTASMPSAVAGTYAVTVVNAAPGGGTSATVNLPISNPLPSITSVSPATGAVGVALPLTVSGTGFVPVSRISVAGTLLPTTLNADGTLSATVTAVLPVGPNPVAVVNPTLGGGTSAAVSITLSYPLPVISKLYVATIAAGAGQFTLYAMGTGFVANVSQVLFGALALPATLNSSGWWTVTVPASAIASGAVVPIALRNGAPGGGTSASLPFTVTNPVPTLTSVAPATVVTGSGATVTLTGTNFVPGSAVLMGGSSVPTVYVSATQLTAAVPAGAPVGSLAVAVSNPAPNGGTTAAKTLTVANSAPTLSGLSPSSAIVGSAATSVTLSGTGFQAGSQVSVNGSPVSTVFVSGTQLAASFPATPLSTTGTRSVTVTNAGTGGGTSASLAFAVVNPVPAITALSPAAATVGAPDTTVTVTGTGFVPSSVVYAGTTALATTFVSSTQLTAVVPSSLLGSTGSLAATAIDPAPGGGTSSPATFAVLNPLPTTSAGSPNSGIVGDPDTTVTLSGTGFVASSTVYSGPTQLVTAFTGSTQLTAVIPASMLASVGSLSLTVSNPAPGGGASAPVSFAVNNPAPAIATVSPASAIVGSADTMVTVNGTGFIASSTLYVGTTLLATTFVGATQLTAVVPASMLSSTGALSLTVANPAPGGGANAPTSFMVNNPAPSVSALSPSAVVFGAPATSVTVSGSGFVASSVVYAGTTPLATTFVGATQLTAIVPASMLASVGSLSVTVANPAPGGGASAPVPFNVGYPVPTISSLHANTVAAGSGAYILYAMGTGFLPGKSTILFGSLALAATMTNNGWWTATVPASALAVGATVSVALCNPSPGGGASSTLPFYVTNPLPRITTLSPAAAYAGFTMKITGTGFVPGSVVTAGGTPLVTTLNADGTLSAVVPPDFPAGRYGILVVNAAPGGGPSNPAIVTVNPPNPAPVISKLYQSTVAAGTASYTLYAMGTGFVAGQSQVLFGSHALPATLNASGWWTVTVPASAIATAGTVAVALYNPAPGGGTSATLPFTVK